jgi:hypothetical protein
MSQNGSYATLDLDGPNLAATAALASKRPSGRPIIEGAMNTPNQKDNSNDTVRSVTSLPHPWVYATLIGLVLWFVLWIWSFAGAGVTDYLLVIISGFFLVVVALMLILSRVGHKDPAMGDNEAKADDKPESFHDWGKSDFDTEAGRLSSRQAAMLILLPIAAAAFGMTAFGIAFLIAEHGGV